MTPEEFKQRRIALGLTQQEVADIFNCSDGLVSQWETGAVPLKGMAMIAMSNLHLSACPTCNRPYVQLKTDYHLKKPAQAELAMEDIDI